ncbi:ABC transporter substrate-binding protein [Streptomyces albidoflavus]|uniref:Peptide-binding protein n=1 Tax=Streptomyces albidoflavus TaxID=1886 RepID=A0AB37X793_9ACTN|nr:MULTISPECIES: ABC transporter substrate-binding protein [Streptomyces]QLA59785.1 peptide-binding protein [Streptomyces violascens]AWL31386.1 peptide-binding protein [Streptomyces sp. SM17]RZE33223.1 peptide-binding protein [Streptomyces albidoflavus]RZE53197.1 peptide-binding protein [Streptomyces albidoflavus]WTB74497.1 ABC transporter substrate-binding protein [Streptomyces albidoflavus]
MNRKTLVLPAVVGLLAPVLAACGGSDGADQGGDAIVVGTTDRFAASQEAPAPLDPASAYDAGAWNVLRQTIQTLVTLPRGGGEPVPEAAETCSFTDAGNERYSCRLREGLTFSNGDELTAEDVKFSIDRTMRIKDSNGPVGLLANIDTVETRGEREVVFHLHSPDATFPYKLATPAAGIVNEADYPGDKVRKGFDVSGSGPYSVQTEVEDNQVVKLNFSANSDYKGSLKLKNEKVVMRSFADPDTMGKALESGEVDLMTRTISPQQIKKYTGDQVEKIRLVEMPGLEIRYLGFNTDDPKADKAIRQAMGYLIDRGTLTSKVYGTAAEPLYSLVPTTITGHTNSFFNQYGEQPDPAKAKAALQQAGIDTPVELTLNYTTDHYGQGTEAEFKEISRQLDASGLFKTDVKGTGWDKYRAAQVKGEYPVFGMGWFPDFPDADNFLAPFLDKDNFLSSPYSNKNIQNKLIPASRREADRSAAADPIKQMQDIVAQDVPVLPLWQGKQYVAARDDIIGVEWALDSSSNIQLWELDRGVSS